MIGCGLPLFSQCPPESTTCSDEPCTFDAASGPSVPLPAGGNAAETLRASPSRLRCPYPLRISVVSAPVSVPCPYNKSTTHTGARPGPLPPVRGGARRPGAVRPRGVGAHGERAGGCGEQGAGLVALIAVVLLCFDVLCRGSMGKCGIGGCQAHHAPAAWFVSTSRALQVFTAEEARAFYREADARAARERGAKKDG